MEKQIRKYNGELDDCFYFVEANEFEQHTLWQDYSLEYTELYPEYAEAEKKIKTRGIGSDRLDWKQVSQGIGMRIASLDGRPITISINWAIIEGQKVCFWHDCSQLVDHDIIDCWFKKNVKRFTKHNTDARNFRICARELTRLRRAKPLA